MQYFYSIAVYATIAALLAVAAFNVVRFVTRTSTPVYSNSCEYQTDKNQECISEKLEYTPEQLLNSNQT